jgi:hypothetical protein
VLGLRFAGFFVARTFFFAALLLARMFTTSNCLNAVYLPPIVHPEPYFGRRKLRGDGCGNDVVLSGWIGNYLAPTDDAESIAEIKVSASEASGAHAKDLYV